MTDNSKRVLAFLKENYGTRMTGHEIADELDVKINVVTGSVNGLCKKGYAVRTEETVKGPDGKDVVMKYISLTEAGMAYDPIAEEEAAAAEKARKAAEKAARKARKAAE